LRHRDFAPDGFLNVSCQKVVTPRLSLREVFREYKEKGEKELVISSTAKDDKLFL